MNPKEFSDRIESEYENLKDAEEEYDFTVSSDIGESELVFSGDSKRNDRWGDNKYAVDATLELMAYSDDTDMDIVDSYIMEVKNSVNRAIGYRGPIILRSSEDETVLGWSRRLILSDEE